MRRSRLVELVVASSPFLGLAACGGGGGPGGGRFPGASPTDLVASVVDLDDDGEDLRQLVVSDLRTGARVVFTAFADPATGGVEPEGLVWSPDHERVAYFARPDGGALAHLFVLEPRFGEPHDLVGVAIEASGLDASFSTLAWSPDGARLSFTVVDEGGVSRVLLVDPDGSDLVDLFAISPPGGLGMNGQAAWAPNSSRVAVPMTLSGGAGDRVYTFRADGSGFSDVTASPAPVAGAGVFKIVWNPQSNRVLITGALEQAGFVDAYVARGNGGVPVVRVSPHTGGGALSRAAWSPDGQRIAYLSNLASGGVTQELFTVAPDGTGHVKVSGSVVADGRVADFFWAPDGSRLAFLADRFQAGTFELFTVLPTGAGLTGVSPALAADGDVKFGQGVDGQSDSPWAPDGLRLVFLADEATDRAFLVAGDGSDAFTLASAATGGTIQAARWSPDGTHVLIEGELGLDGVSNVYVVAVGTPGASPGSVVPLSFATEESTSARVFDWSADGRSVAFGQRVSSAPGSLTVGRASPRSAADVRDLTDPAATLHDLVTR